MRGYTSSAGCCGEMSLLTYFKKVKSRRSQGEDAAPSQSRNESAQSQNESFQSQDESFQSQDESFQSHNESGNSGVLEVGGYDLSPVLIIAQCLSLVRCPVQVKK